jgi:hypothetical protein
MDSFMVPLAAQRLAAQPLGHTRYIVTILAGFLKSHFGVHSLSLGQVGCSRGLGSSNFVFIVITYCYYLINFTSFRFLTKTR